MARKMFLDIFLLQLFGNFVLRANSAHHACLLGLSGLKSNMVTISRDIIHSTRSIDSYIKFTILTRDIQQGNQSYSDFTGVQVVYGSMLNVSDVKQACSNADIGIFAAPSHSTLTRLDISKIVLDGLQQAGVKYFIYAPGHLKVSHSYHQSEELYKFLRQQVLTSRFKDYSIVSTGGWMELYFPQKSFSFISSLKLPIFFGVNLPHPHQYSSMKDIGPVTALVLYRIIFKT